jgi:hypothetical protein
MPAFEENSQSAPARTAADQTATAPIYLRKLTPADAVVKFSRHLRRHAGRNRDLKDTRAPDLLKHYARRGCANGDQHDLSYRLGLSGAATGVHWLRAAARLCAARGASRTLYWPGWRPNHAPVADKDFFTLAG